MMLLLKIAAVPIWGPDGAGGKLWRIRTETTTEPEGPEIVGMRSGEAVFRGQQAGAREVLRGILRLLHLRMLETDQVVQLPVQPEERGLLPFRRWDLKPEKILLQTVLPELQPRGMRYPERQRPLPVLRYQRVTDLNLPGKNPIVV